MYSRKMNEEDIRKLIANDELWRFYKTRAWLELREQVLEDNHWECVWCKAEGKIVPAETVHHVLEVKQYPQYALMRVVAINGKTKMNLVPLCHSCHDKAHKRFAWKERQKPITEERW